MRELRRCERMGTGTSQTVCFPAHLAGRSEPVPILSREEMPCAS